MTYADIVRAFAVAKGFPERAVEAAVHADAATADRMVALLKRARTPALLTDQEFDAIFLLVHVLAERRETRAFAPLLGVLRLDAETLEELFGDALIETLPSMMIALYDGDLAQLKSFILSRGLDHCVRSAALHLFVYLALTGDIDTDDARALLLKLREDEDPTEESFVWTGWADAIADLGFDDLSLMVEELAKQGGLGTGQFRMMDFSDFEDRQRSVRGATNRLQWMRDKGYAPFGRAADTIARWYDENENSTQGIGDPEEVDDPDHPAFLDRLPQTVTNPNRNVGRNDPCPCGSGKKYKKCCLAAE